MGRPGTSTTLTSSLGKVEATDDGVSLLVLSGIAVGGQFALGDVLGPFLQLTDAEDKGIDEAYDTANSTIAWKHIKDFYEEAPVGTKLYVMVVAMTQTLTTTATLATATGYRKAILAAGGAIRLVGLTFTPDGTYVPTYADQLEDDLWDALVQIKLTAEADRAAKDPYRVLVEGRNFQGTITSLLDMRSSGTTPGVNRALVCIGNDYDYGSGAGVKSKYAAVGKLLGRAAFNKVNRNVGRVLDGPVAAIDAAGLSNGALLSTFTSAHLDLANDYGYVFLTKHKRKAGFYWNDDSMACVVTDPFSNLTLGRMIDKVDVITHSTNVERILDEIEVDPLTGKLDVATAKQLESLLEDAINDQMGGTNKEISGVKVYVDPDQNIIETSIITESNKIVPTGVLRQLNTTIELASSLE
jgi:hypothetical protein